MNAIRLLFWLAIGWLVWRVLARALRPTTQPPAASGSDPDYIMLTRCSSCGAHIPQPRAAEAPICERCRSG